MQPTAMAANNLVWQQCRVSQIAIVQRQLNPSFAGPDIKPMTSLVVMRGQSVKR